MDCRIQINGEDIGKDCPVYIIAEIGINHNGDVKIAEEMIRTAAKTGVNAVKFQTYITEKRVSQNSPIFDPLKKCELSYPEQAELKTIADAEGITFFSTPFDGESVDFLSSLDVAAYKIASFELVNLALVRQIASQKKSVIASSGMADRKEIDQALQILDMESAPYALLHCVSAYPTAFENANLNVIRSLKKVYDCPVGYSDHTLGIEVPVYAVAVGATIIEKHFTLDKAMDGPDHSMSVDPGEMSEMVRKCREIKTILGNGDINLSEAEVQFTWLRRPSE